EEVRGQDLVGVLSDELPPRALAAARRRLQAMAAGHLANGHVGAAVTQLEQLANDPPVAPAFVLTGQLHDGVVKLAAGHGSTAGWPSSIGSPICAEPSHDASAAASPALG